ncbi:hypothetical protein PR202_gb15415 [Eleusine coracana subsp. coracana]|uniref:DUF6598 domain-containing protein n=1 Tax=Eleusine coracana subsp. coracana TaxID=191504 RepID=A0AAV5EXK4_ELECO|nr:hypothetical protein PR202_gb15415 [Eleusine coracana subsp. coracana]
MEVDPLLERGMAVVWKSGHKGEAEDDATKRRKIHGDGIAELQRLDGKGDGEKMEVDEVREGEVVKKRDLYVEYSEQRVGVVFADWPRTAEQKESDKREGGCEAAKMDPDAECQRTVGESHDSSNVQMEVEDLFLHREVEKKEDHKREAGGEAVKNLEHTTGKMDQTRECEASKMDDKAEEWKRRLKEYEQWRKKKEEEEEMVAPDPEELTDYHAFHARSFEQRWKDMYDNWIFGSFHDKKATIRVDLIDGLWPDDFRGHFVARTASINEEVLLLDSGDEKLPVAGNEIQLSRRVVSVESNGTLTVSVEASQGDNCLKDEKVFRPQEMDTHSETLDIVSNIVKLAAHISWIRRSYY